MVNDVSALTDYGTDIHVDLLCLFYDFVKLAQDSDVKMKVMQIDTYSISSFSSVNSGVIVND